MEKSLADKKVTTHDFFGNTYDVLPKDLNWKVAAYAIITKGEHVLILPTMGKHGLPGGGVEIGENFVEAVEREVFEETGFVVQAQDVVHVEADFLTIEGKGHFQGVCMYFACNILSGELTDAGFEPWEKKNCKIATWMDMATVSKEEFLNPVDKKVIKKLLA